VERRVAAGEKLWSPLRLSERDSQRKLDLPIRAEAHAAAMTIARFSGPLKSASNQLKDWWGDANKVAVCHYGITAIRLHSAGRLDSDGPFRGAGVSFL
jgi:hypothetical protein